MSTPTVCHERVKRCGESTRPEELELSRLRTLSLFRFRDLSLSSSSLSLASRSSWKLRSFSYASRRNSSFAVKSVGILLQSMLKWRIATRKESQTLRNFELKILECSKWSLLFSFTTSWVHMNEKMYLKQIGAWMYTCVPPVGLSTLNLRAPSVVIAGPVTCTAHRHRSQE